MERRKFLNLSVTGTAALMASPLLNSCENKISQKPNVIFILTDQWRASAFGYAGDPNVKTPHIDQFANEAVRFSNAVSVCPVCTPYRASLMTGKYPTSTGMFLVYYFTGQWEISAGFGIGDVVLKLLFYFAHERVWNMIDYGRSLGGKITSAMRSPPAVSLRSDTVSSIVQKMITSNIGAIIVVHSSRSC